MLFNRECSLIIGKDGGKGKELKNLRIAFSIQKTSTKTPNKCTVKVWNCSKETRGLISVIGNVLILKAGYKEDIGPKTIFSGNITFAITSREGPDWVTDLELGDGYLEYRDNKISISFGPGATVGQVIGKISDKFDLPVRALPSDISSKQYLAGFAYVGRVRDAMDKACENGGLEWSIQNRQVQIINKGGTYKQQAYLLSSDTGMIGSPSEESKTMTEKAAAKEGITTKQPGVIGTLKKNDDGETKNVLKVTGYKVKSLLQPLIEPGSLIKIKSENINGEFFRVEELTHNGDTHGQDWHSELTIRRIK